MKVIRYAYLAAVLALACGVASAADITGYWLASAPGTRGRSFETLYILKAEGAEVTGSVVNSRNETHISDGKIEGDSFSFVLKMRFGTQQRSVVHTGRVVGDELHLRRPRPDGSPGSEIIARRIEKSAIPPAIAEVLKPLPPVELPALRKLPENGLARTPPMGWNSWNHFHRDIDDKTVREIADAIVSTGMRDAGYIYVNIDDTWEGTRDEQGNIRTNEKFPNMKALADYVHSKGLRLGIYSSPGPKTCAGYEGSYAHEAQDARTYAAWGIDYLKYDWCSARRAFPQQEMPRVYQKMAEALRATGRPIVYSLCQYGLENVERWGAAAGGNLWRTTGDIRDNWKSMSDIGFGQNGLEQYAGVGHWNDPDMLEIGNGGMTDTEYRTHMSLWSILAAPLLAGNDIRNISQATLAILTNREVIAIDQDRLGKQGKRIAKNGDSEVWAKPLANGEVAVGLFNRGEAPARISVRWREVGFQGKHKVRDLWAHTDRGSIADEFSAEVPSHGVVLVRVSK